MILETQRAMYIDLLSDGWRFDLASDRYVRGSDTLDAERIEARRAGLPTNRRRKRERCKTRRRIRLAYCSQQRNDVDTQIHVDRDLARRVNWGAR